VVGNLWDVTDRDIDRFSRTMLKEWRLWDKSNESDTTKDDINFNDNRSTSLVEAVALARDSCTLPYLIGAAPIVYGVPVYLSSESE